MRTGAGAGGVTRTDAAAAAIVRLGLGLGLDDGLSAVRWRVLRMTVVSRDGLQRVAGHRHHAGGGGQGRVQRGQRHTDADAHR